MQESNAAASPAANSRRSPYVGPRPFTTADRDIFFGRNQEAIELSSLVKAHPEVLLYAPSGAGKTSLLYAQVLPILESDEDFDMLPLARVRSQESAIIPDEKINNIYVFNALKDLSNDKLSVLERSQLTIADFLAKQPRALSGEWERQPGDQDAPERRLPRIIVFDQFEEIFTLYPERYKDREGFFRQVTEALEADPFLRVVFSMREDYIAELDPYTDILPQGMRTRFRLERLRKSNALACVKRPLESERCKESRRHFEPNAAEALVDKLMAIKVKSPSGEKIEVPGEFVDPVQLQVVCQTLWQKLPPDDISISKEDIDKYANVDEALLDFYEGSIRDAVVDANKTIQSMAGEGISPVPPAITEAVVRGWFEQRLITRENKRSMVNRERDMTAGLPNVVVDELENQHLIRVELRGGEPWYELSHDRFIAPIRESNRRFLLQLPVAKRKAQELEQRAEEWWNAQRDPKLLLDRGELADAQNWMRTEAAAIGGLSNNLYALIQASKAAIQDEDNLHQQELADALQQKATALQEKATAERQRGDALQQAATLQRQRARHLKIGWVVTSVLLLFTVGSTVFAVNRWRKANREEAEAWTFYEKAQKSAALARTEADRANVASREAQDAAAKLKTANTDLQEQTDVAVKATQDATDALALANKESAAAQAAKKQLEVALTDTQQANDQLAALTDKLKDSRNKAYSVTAAAWAQLALQNNEKDLGLLLALKSADEQLATSTDPRIERPKQAAVRRAWLKFVESRELKGHQDVVWKAIPGPDGRVFTISDDHTVRIWPADLKGEPVVLDLEAPVHDLAITTDGRYLATEQMNNEGSIWRLSDSTKLVALRGLTGPVATIAFSPDGKLLVTEATDDQQKPLKPGAAPRIWDVPAGTVRAVLKGHEAAVCDVAFSPNGDMVATASWDGTARTWDSKTGTPKAVFRNHTAALTSIAFDPTGRWVVTASFDGTARVWNAETGEEKSKMVGHEGVVISAVFSPRGKWVLTAGKTINKDLPGVETDSLKLPKEIEQKFGTRDVTARIWDVETGRLTTVLRGHTHDVNQASYSSDGNLIVTASADGSAKVWSAQDGIIVGELRKSRPVISAIFSADRNSVLLSGEDYEASVWRLPSASELVLNVSPESVTSLRFNSTGELVTAASDGSIRFWNPQSKDFRTVRSDAKERFNDAAVSPDNRYLVTASRVQRAMTKQDYEIQKGPEAKTGDFVARVWDVQAKKFLPDLTGHKAAVISVLFSRNGEFLLTVGSDRVQVWQVENWQKVREITSTGSRILSAAFADQTNEVVVLDKTAVVIIWQIGTDNVRTVQLRDSDLLTGAFNANATRIVTANDVGDLRVWTVSGKPLAKLEGEEYVTSLVFSSDDRLIAASKGRSGIEVWETSTGQPIAEFSERATRSNFSEVAFDSTNSVILAASGDGTSGRTGGTVRAFKCEACQPFATILQLALQLKPRELTEDELDWYLPDINEVTELPQPIATPPRGRERSRRP